ncbi:hypothetical protein BSSX_p0061 (plasmid) [Bacillus subtilis]|nr:hypothetical protein BSSX_p0061 [Bacillus subtilis]
MPKGKNNPPSGNHLPSGRQNEKRNEGKTMTNMTLFYLR